MSDDNDEDRVPVLDATERVQKDSTVGLLWGWPLSSRLLLLGGCFCSGLQALLFVLCLLHLGSLIRFSVQEGSADDIREEALPFAYFASIGFFASFGRRILWDAASKKFLHNLRKESIYCSLVSGKEYNPGKLDSLELFIQNDLPGAAQSFASSIFSLGVAIFHSATLTLSLFALAPFLILPGVTLGAVSSTLAGNNFFHFQDGQRCITQGWKKGGLQKVHD